MLRARSGILGILLLAALSAPAAALADSSLLVIIGRIDDFAYPSQQFSLGLVVRIGLPGVTGVGVQTTQGGASYTLAQEYTGSTEWNLPDDLTFATLGDVKAALDGEWVVTTSGSGAVSSSHFTLDAASLVEGHFFATPGSLSPAQGAVDVPAGTGVSWTDPTGTTVPYVLIVQVETVDPFSLQEAMSLVGDIDVGATSWQPPLSLGAGLNELSVFYAADPLPSLVTTITTDTGAIVWISPDESPPSYPDQTPLLALASESVVEFTVVPEPAAAALQLAAFAALGAIARRRGAHTRANTL